MRRLKNAKGEEIGVSSNEAPKSSKKSPGMITTGDLDANKKLRKKETPDEKK